MVSDRDDLTRTYEMWAEEPGIRVNAEPWGAEGVILTIYDIDGSLRMKASIAGYRWKQMLTMLQQARHVVPQ